MSTFQTPASKSRPAQMLNHYNTSLGKHLSHKKMFSLSVAVFVLYMYIVSMVKQDIQLISAIILYGKLQSTFKSNSISLTEDACCSFFLFFLVFVYLIYTYRDNAQQKCCAKVSYKANLHFQSWAGCCYKITIFNQKQYNRTHTISHHTPLN